MTEIESDGKCKPDDERRYLAMIAEESCMYAWCLMQHGGMTRESAEAAAKKFYKYEPPENHNRDLVFHDQAWHWAMLRIIGDGYWRTRPDLEGPSAEYDKESRRCIRDA